MSDEKTTKEVEELLKKAKKLNKIKSYNDIYNSKEYKEYAVEEDDVAYYTSKYKNSIDNIEIGDIVFC